LSRFLETASSLITRAKIERDKKDRLCFREYLNQPNLINRITSLAFRALLFFAFFILCVVSGINWFFAIFTSFLVLTLFMVANFASCGFQSKPLKAIVFSLVFTLLPAIIFTVMGQTTSLTQRIGGRDIFIGGSLTSSGAISLSISFFVVSVIVYTSHTLFRWIINRG